MKTTKKILAGLALAVGAVAAHAGSVYSADMTGAGEQATGTAMSASFTSTSADAAMLQFTLQGYATLDGDDYWIDIFHLAVNGTEVFSGTFDLGGGGTNRVLSDATGAATVTPGEFPWYQNVTIALPVQLLAGNNTLDFSYESPTTFEGTDRAGVQGTGDEGWGVGGVSVDVTPVPEPETLALTLAGLGLLAGVQRRRQRQG